VKILLWVLQVMLGIYFTGFGVIHFIVPPNLPMGWMYELPDNLHYITGTLEILGGIGLILPAATRIQTRLTPLAGLGLALLMLGAMSWHATRSEYSNIGQNLILAALAAFIAYGRWRLSPLLDRD
jgi:uncharacterized membrane protein